MSVNPRVANACVLFAKYMGRPSRVYYPACGKDASPPEAFPGAYVVYLDIEEQGLLEIQREYADARAVHLPAEVYDPDGRFDFVLSVHSHAPFEAEIKFLQKDGFLLIANKMSDRAFDHPNLELVAVITEQPGEGREMLFTDLERFEEVDPSPEEFSFSNRRKIKAPFYVFRKIA